MFRRLVAIPFRFMRWSLAALSGQVQNVVTALVQIWANKGRSILTTLGIIIAVTSIITVVAFVQGFGNYTTKMLQGFGTQFMVVRPYVQRGGRGMGMKASRLDVHDLEALRAECPDVRRITPFVFSGNGQLTYGKEKAENVPVRGVAEQYQTIRNFFADAGRFFGPVDVENSAHVIVLGRAYLKLLECDESIVGDYVHLNGLRFRVIGLLESKGSFLGGDQDETVMIPYTTALNMYPSWRQRLFCLAEATSEGQIDQAYAQITRVLRRRHGLKPGQPDDFDIERQDQALKQFEKVRNVASGSLAGIVSISLLVGGIGIMNVMLVSVTERTREIGLRKSIGARRRDIMLQFLTEAVVLCTIGGIVGIALGYAIVHIASLHPQMLEADVPLWSVALALFFSAGAGMIFGIIPAFKAAILHPIDALRHE